RDNAPIPLVNSYQAGDGRWFWLIGLEADRHFPGLLAAIDRQDLAQDERFDTHDVWWAPAQSMAEVVEDPQLRAVGAFVEIENPGGDPIPSVNSPITFRG